jgi:hypothetical protein
MHAVSKYLKRHAEPETGLGGLVAGGYARSIVVPLFREDPSFVDGVVRAAETSSGRTLCIAVVNAPEDASPDAHADNARLIDGLRGRVDRAFALESSSGAWLGACGERLDLLVVDRASEGKRLPVKEGVGLARKIGTDLALALHVSGKVESSLIFGTDADAVLPDRHFDLDAPSDADAAAFVFPFWHEATTDMDVTRATALYELSLRYYVAGLAWAKSPYAFHTLGSAIAVSGHHYAAVRGYPKREAAEDFYLLNKIAKVGVVVRVQGAPVRIRSRTSDRTPFGTGRRVSDSIASGDQRFYAPGVFSALRTLLGVLEAYAEHGVVSRLYEGLDEFSEGLREVTLSLFDEIGARDAFTATTREAKTAGARLRRVHSWFDAFRTLKFIHALRDRLFPSVGWRDALDAAPFYPAPSKAPLGVDDARRAFAEAERGLPPHVGATLSAFSDRGRPSR